MRLPAENCIDLSVRSSAKFAKCRIPFLSYIWVFPGFLSKGESRLALTLHFLPATWTYTQAFHIRAPGSSDSEDRTYPPSRRVPWSLFFRWRLPSYPAGDRVQGHKDAY